LEDYALFGAIGYYYSDFRQISDQEVSEILARFKPGQVQVVLEVFSHVKVGDSEGRAQVRVFQDTWNMEAKGLEWIKYQVAEIQPMWAFLCAVISAIAGTLAFFGIKGLKTAKSRGDI